MISDYLFRTDVIVTSILHDTIEDTELTKEKIAEEFGWKVANQVMDLTRIKEDGVKISAAEMVEVLYKEKKHDVLLIKLFDRLHNIQTIDAKSPKKIKKIVTETIGTFLILSKYLELESVKLNLFELCHKYIIRPHYNSTTTFNPYSLLSSDTYQPLFPVFQNDIDRKHII